MWLIVLEALAALLILLLAVWWTMFSGRRGGERAPTDAPVNPPGQEDAVSPIPNPSDVSDARDSSDRRR